MSESEWRALSLRVRALMHRRTAAYLELAATMTQVTAALRGVVEALQQVPAEHLIEHPDLAEWDLQMNGFYGPTP